MPYMLISRQAFWPMLVHPRTCFLLAKPDMSQCVTLCPKCVSLNNEKLRTASCHGAKVSTICSWPPALLTCPTKTPTSSSLTSLILSCNGSSIFPSYLLIILQSSTDMARVKISKLSMSFLLILLFTPKKMTNMIALTYFHLWGHQPSLPILSTIYPLLHPQCYLLRMPLLSLMKYQPLHCYFTQYFYHSDCSQEGALF